MAPTRADLELAVAAYWQTKGDQLAAAEAIQSTAEGTSRAIRGGKHFNPVVNLIARFFIDAATQKRPSAPQREERACPPTIGLRRLGI
jgi:hypothetical protein